MQSSDIHQQLRSQGFSLLGGDVVRQLLANVGAVNDWSRFSETWADLAPDTYMADGGRYRRRRHARVRIDRDGVKRLPHGPHYQGLDYNQLNGGVERWFEAIAPETWDMASLQTILTYCQQTFEAVSSHRAWFVELHQFRIEARPNEPGQPTPEGAHRDGVDYVLVLMIKRTNINSGVTTIMAPDGKSLGTFTLSNSFDAALIDDHRVFHGVTAVEALDPGLAAHRDVLVVTFKALR